MFGRRSVPPATYIASAGASAFATTASAIVRGAMYSNCGRRIIAGLVEIAANPSCRHPAGHVPAHAAGGTLAEAAARVAPPMTEDSREWVSRVHDRQDEVQEAQAKVRRLEAQADSLRAQAAASSDPDARGKADRDLMDTLDDLEKAEKKLAKAQRELDEAVERARSAGVQVQR